MSRSVMKGWVTINTDAGFWPSHNVGSYAFWIRANGLFLKGSGVFKEKCKCPKDAEFKSLLNALHVLKKSGYKGITKIVINRDNIYVTARKKGTDHQRSLHNAIRSFRNESKKIPGLKLWEPFCEIRHVKAHSGTDTPRKYVNDWCDQQCKLRLLEWKAKKSSK